MATECIRSRHLPVDGYACRFGGHPTEFKASGVCPDTRLPSDVLLSSAGSSRVRVSPLPRYYEDAPTPVRPSHRTPLRCAALPWVCLSFAPAIGDTRPRAWRWVHGDLPTPTCPRRPTGLSGSWGTPVWARHGLRPRQDRKRQAQYSVPTRPPLWQRRGLLRARSFRGSIHGQHTRCLRFAAGVAAVHARLASGCGPTLPDGVGYPSGSTERFQGHFQRILSSFPKLTDAMPLVLSVYVRTGHVAEAIQFRAFDRPRLAEARVS